MRITCLIANFNYSKYLRKAIDSCLSQTFKPACVCIVDAGSTDNSWEIIGEYVSFNQREEQRLETDNGDVELKIGSINGVDIVGLKLPKQAGPSEARNYGIKLTQEHTDVYAILDADDSMLPTKLEQCIEPFVNETVGVVYANYYNINVDNGTKILEVKEPFDIFRLQKECIVHSGSLIRASVLEKVKNELGYYDESMRTCEDWDLWLRLVKYCSFYHVPEALTEVLVHENNSTNSVNKEIWQQNWARIQQKHFS